MAYFNVNSNMARALVRPAVLNESLRTFSASSSQQRQVFLSYRHSDKYYIHEIVTFLKNLGVPIYVDYLDENLSQSKMEEVAGIIRKQIGKSSKFIQVVSPNSSESKWLPWEIGVGDGVLGTKNAILMPVTINNGYNPYAEHLSIYGHIDKVYSTDRTIYDWAVIYPDDTKNIWLKKWLQS